MFTNRLGSLVITATTACLLTASVMAQDDAAPPTPLHESFADGMPVRPIGPTNMSGRIIDIAVYPQDTGIYYLASASGGVLKTTNNGTRFEHLFTDQSTVSIGAIAVAATDPDLVWVGTGESNPRNSVSWGDGVYKSTDGGATWKNMGLTETFQIGEIVIHPEDHDTVFVGAMGRLWGPNEERGLFKTTDGGDTWDKVFYVDDKTSVTHIEMHPEDPDTMLIATYERQRDQYDTNDPAKKFGPGAGIWRTTDGGESFDRMTEGLPTVELGRMDLDWYQADPNVVYAIIETMLVGTEPENAAYMGIRGEDAGVGARLTEITEGGPAETAELKSGDVVLKMEDKPTLSYEALTTQIRQHEAGDTVEIEFARDGDIMTAEVSFEQRPSQREDDDDEDGNGNGESDGDAEEKKERDIEAERRSSPFGTRLGGQQANVQDQQGPDGHEYGGIFRSDDAGVSWKRINSLNPRPMYFSCIRVDPSDNNHIFVGGIALHRSSDGGETFTADGNRDNVHVDNHAMWVNPDNGKHIRLGCDGGYYETFDRMERWTHHNKFDIAQFYHIGVGPRENFRVFGGLQDNGSWGGPSVARGAPGPRNEDWFRIGGGDGFICLVDPNDPDQIYYESQNGGLGRTNLRTGEGGFLRPRAPRGTQYRWAWRTPFILSEHNSRVYYTAGNHVFRSMKKGSDPKQISPDIAHTDRGAATALAESPIESDYLWVGTDDGALWATWDGGANWHDLFTYEAPADDGDDDAAQADRPRRRGGNARGEGRRGQRARGERGDRAERDRPERANRPAPGGPESLPAGRGAMIYNMIVSRDANGDGEVSMDEVPDRMKGLLEHNDTNGDGKLDAAELKKLARSLGVDPGEGDDGDDSSGASEEAEPEAEQDDEPATDEAATDAAAGVDLATGTWKAEITEEGMGDDGGFTMNLKAAGRKLTGSIDSPMGETEIESGSYNMATGKVSIEVSAEFGDITFSGTIKGATMTGTLEAGGGGFSAGFEATRTTDPVGTVAGAIERGSDDGNGGDDADASDDNAARRIDALVDTRMAVAEIAASRHDRDRVYIVLDGHRVNDDLPHVFMSGDAGKTWASLRGDLPDSAGSARTITEDRINENVLYLGTEFGLYVTADRGQHWTRMKSGFPTVAVHGIAQHASSSSVAIGTHGRSAWIADVGLLRQLSAKAVQSNLWLYEPSDVTYWQSGRRRGGTNHTWTGRNPSQSAQIFYSLRSEADDVAIRIENMQGDVLRTLSGSGDEGLNSVTWDMRGVPQTRSQPQRRRRIPRVGPGTYRVVIESDGQSMEQTVTVKGDPDSPPDARAEWGEEWEEHLEMLELFNAEEGGDNDDADRDV